MARDVSGDAAEVLATLLSAAKEDDAFRRYVLFLLRLPERQRESLVNSAVHEMKLRREPASAIAAFACLATAEGAATALRFLENA